MKKIICIPLAVMISQIAFAQHFVSAKGDASSFPVSSSAAAAIYVEKNDDWLANRAATLLQSDVEAVTGKKPVIVHRMTGEYKNVIVIGTATGSSLVKKLVAEKKLDIPGLKGKWEAFHLQTISRPMAGVDKALVITGSDKRGTAYGVLELSRQLGVSPWYWWADVPVKKKETVFVKAGTYKFASPSVKYRGIFINDEAPAFSGWTKEKFGGFNHKVYEKVFELLLRLKGNYLWPAMWGNAFNDDDTLNPVLADKWGIVMGSSHHEPMLRAQQEWKRYGKGAWDYTKNDTTLRAFWRDGIRNMGKHESILTIGMRGDGDEPMTQGTAIELLERIVRDQRRIIEEVTGRPAAQTPQIWALYKEVQDYYDKGMRVPDDVTLLLCDDNWGNIRRLPKITDKPRSGGYGIYYHFDYVGGPRNYKWLNTNNIARVWEQMHLAYEHGADKIWIVNVGDIKPMEFPISFFLDYAWNTKAWNEDNLRSYYTQWAGDQFGDVHGKEIGELLRKYSQYSSRRKPELLDAATYSLTAYNEAERIVAQWKELMAQAEKVNSVIASEYKDAYFQLVLHPIKALGNLHQLYHAVAKNKSYASQKNLLANQWADSTAFYYLTDSLLSLQYNRELSGGKWNHMMDQTHIGYTTWQQPEKNTMPAVVYVSPDSAQTSNAISFQNEPATGASKKMGSNTFFQNDRVVSMLAAHFTKAIHSTTIRWKIIPDIGREGDGVTTFPVTSASPETFTNSAPHLEYLISVTDTGMVKLSTYFSPTLNFHGTPEGLQFAVSVDNEPPQILSLNKEDKNSISGVWNSWVANNIIIKTSLHRIAQPGRHIVKYWAISPGVVLQKLVLDFGGVKPGYLGPPEPRN